MCLCYWFLSWYLEDSAWHSGGCSRLQPTYDGVFESFLTVSSLAASLQAPLSLVVSFMITLCGWKLTSQSLKGTNDEVYEVVEYMVAIEVASVDTFWRGVEEDQFDEDNADDVDSIWKREVSMVYANYRG